MNVDINTISTIELKALAFDILQQQQLNQKNLDAIITELQKRVNLPPPPTLQNTVDLNGPLTS
jgi:hypothetical protein